MYVKHDVPSGWQQTITSMDEIDVGPSDPTIRTSMPDTSTGSIGGSRTPLSGTSNCKKLINH